MACIEPNPYDWKPWNDVTAEGLVDNSAWYLKKNEPLTNHAEELDPVEAAINSVVDEIKKGRQPEQDYEDEIASPHQFIPPQAGQALPTQSIPSHTHTVQLAEEFKKMKQEEYEKYRLNQLRAQEQVQRELSKQLGQAARASIEKQAVQAFGGDSSWLRKIFKKL